MLLYDCRNMAELSTEYLEGELSWWQRLHYYMHLWVCPPCQNYREQVRMTAEACHHAEAAEATVAPAPPEDLLAKVREQS